MMTRGIGGHHRGHIGYTCEWLTPPELLAKLGEFDLDPCSPVRRPSDTAAKHFTIEDDGLAQPWYGRVWLNPPYGPYTWKWLSRLADHGDGIALIYARTETVQFFASVWDRADAVLFLKGRLNFHLPSGERSERNAGAPSVLVAYGERNVQALEDSGVDGKFIHLTPNHH